MKLLLIGRAGSRACDWSGYALLRDNAARSHPGDAPNVELPVLSSIQRAAEEGETLVDAVGLRDEVVRAWHAVLDIPLAAVQAERAEASSAETINTGSARAENATAWQHGVGPLDTARLVAAAKRFVAAVLELTERLEEGETLEVRIEGSAQPFAARANRQGHSIASAGHGLARLGLKSFCIS